ncbi:hypothetical protein SME36J_49910 (plasmid) [Serratia marcescens]|nr:hypothetical protein SME36J_49910 [Serratia marcescens]
MGDWFIATEGVKIVKDSPGLWPQIITGFSSAGAALGGVWLTHYFARRREERAAAAKLGSERIFIATELVFLLEQFAEGCAAVATDQGYLNQERITIPEIRAPSLDYSAISGDWRVLPAKLMYRIRELPVMQDEADRTISAAEHIPPDYDEFFEARQYQYTRLGLKAIIQSRRLRRLVGLPHTRLDATRWSAQNVLWQEWRLERNRRSVQARLLRQTIAQMDVALQQSIKNNNLSGRTS